MKNEQTLHIFPVTHSFLEENKFDRGCGLPDLYTCADTCSTLHVAHQHYMNVVDNEAIEYFTVHAALLHLHSNSNLQAANTTLDIKSG